MYLRILLLVAVARFLIAGEVKLAIVETSPAAADAAALLTAEISQKPRIALLDRELTSLLLSRLARETNLLLLERRKLLEIVREKEFAAKTEEFWSGAFLLDGSVDKDGFQADRTTVTVRLVGPDRKARNLDA